MINLHTAPKSVEQPTLERGDIINPQDWYHAWTKDINSLLFGWEQR